MKPVHLEYVKKKIIIKKNGTYSLYDRLVLAILVPSLCFQITQLLVHQYFWHAFIYSYSSWK